MPRWAVDAIGAFGRTPAALAGAAIVGLIALGWIGIYLAGGSRHVSTHWFYFPILLAATRFRIKGSVLVALACGLVAGPLLPSDVAAGTNQSAGAEIVRVTYFVLMGVFMAAIIWRLEESLAKEAQLARHERALAKQEADLAAHQAALVSTVSHEFRTPLSVLLGSSKMLAEFEWSAFERTVVEGMVSSAHRLNDLITAVLAVAEAPFGAEEVSSEVQLDDVVSAVADGLELRKRERLQIDVGSVRLLTNPAILEGLLRQLVSNALKFSPEDSVVEVSVWGSVEEQLYVGVADRGPGIDEAFLPKAFEAFTQEDESATRVNGGLGIGLFVAQRLAECLHSSLELRPREGGGTEAVVIMAGATIVSGVEAVVELEPGLVSPEHRRGARS